MVSHLAGGDRGPEHWRKLRLEGGQVPLVPELTRLSRAVIPPESMMGLIIFQSAESQPTSSNRFFVMTFKNYFSASRSVTNTH